MAMRMQSNWIPHRWLVGMYNGEATEVTGYYEKTELRKR